MSSSISNCASNSRKRRTITPADYESDALSAAAHTQSVSSGNGSGCNNQYSYCSASNRQDTIRKRTRVDTVDHMNQSHVISRGLSKSSLVSVPSDCDNCESLQLSVSLASKISESESEHSSLSLSTTTTAAGAAAAAATTTATATTVAATHNHHHCHAHQVIGSRTPDPDESEKISAAAAATSAASIISPGPGGRISEPVELNIHTKQRSLRWVLQEDTDHFDSKYIRGTPLGQPGTYGRTFRCVERATNKEYAVKIISKEHRSVREMNAFRAEVTALLKMRRDRYIIQLIDVMEDRVQLYIVMELASGGELFDRIREKTHYSEKSAVHVISQLLQAVQHLHQQCIAHCDLKPSNILFSTPAEDAELRIIDFGMAKLWSPHRRHLFSSSAGSSFYASPEMLDRRYGMAADMWSVGVIVFVMLHGYPPFSGKSLRQINSRIRGGFIAEERNGCGPWFCCDHPISSAAKSFITLCLQVDPARRITAGEALEHKWITGEADLMPLSPVVLRGMIGFDSNYKVMRALLGYLRSANLTADDVTLLHQSFVELDKTNSGQVTVAEVQRAFSAPHWQEHTVTPQEIAALFRHVHANHASTINYIELCRVLVHLRVLATQDRLLAACDKLDIEQNGVVGEPELRAVLDSADVDGHELLQDSKCIVTSHRHVSTNGETHIVPGIDYRTFLTLWRRQEVAADSILSETGGDSEAEACSAQSVLTRLSSPDAP
jgi:calcium-dependent protein kinase